MTPTEDQLLLTQGPLYCPHHDCKVFRERNPAFAARLQEARIIAHYARTDAWTQQEIWACPGLGILDRAALERLMTHPTLPIPAKRPETPKPTTPQKTPTFGQRIAGLFGKPPTP